MALLQKEALVLPKYTFAWDDLNCRVCGEPLRLLATQKRKVVSATYGKFVAVERKGYCPAHPQLSVSRSSRLQGIVAPGCNVAYDVMVQIGLARFLGCRQYEEIQVDLWRQFGIDVPVRTITDQAHQFVAYLQLVHEQSLPLLRKSVRQRGGYILHVDGTCEEGSRVLLACVDSLSSQVLICRKIHTENADEVEMVLREVRAEWGCALAAVHDLGKALLAAVARVFPGIPQFLCHYHFVSDVGKDILSPHVDHLRKLFRRTKLRPKLRELCRSLRQFAISAEHAEPLIKTLLTSDVAYSEHSAPTTNAVKGAVHALSTWILAFSRGGNGYGFPFDMPYLTLYDRVLEVHQILSGISASWDVRPRGPLGAVKRLKEILDVVMSSNFTPEFREVVASARIDQEIFERLREAMRVFPHKSSCGEARRVVVERRASRRRMS